MWHLDSGGQRRAAIDSSRVILRSKRTARSECTNTNCWVAIFIMHVRHAVRLPESQRYASKVMFHRRIVKWMLLPSNFPLTVFGIRMHIAHDLSFQSASLIEFRHMTSPALASDQWIGSQIASMPEITERFPISHWPVRCACVNINYLAIQQKPVIDLMRRLGQKHLRPPRASCVQCSFDLCTCASYIDAVINELGPRHAIHWENHRPVAARATIASRPCSNWCKYHRALNSVPIHTQLDTWEFPCGNVVVDGGAEGNDNGYDNFEWKRNRLRASYDFACSTIYRMNGPFSQYQ